MQSASPRLEDCLITACSDYGLFVSGTAQPTIYHCQITDNDGTGVRITDQARPNLGNLYTTSTDDDGQNNFANNGGAEMWFFEGDTDRIYVTYYHDADERRGRQGRPA